MQCTCTVSFSLPPSPFSLSLSLSYDESFSFVFDCHGEFKVHCLDDAIDVLDQPEAALLMDVDVNGTEVDIDVGSRY